MLAKSDVERVEGIEPLYEAWEAAVLPLNYTRSARYSSVLDSTHCCPVRTDLAATQSVSLHQTL